MISRVLIIAAHPDDDVLGCGGFISKYNNKGVGFSVLFIAEGSSCRFYNPDCEDSLRAISERNMQARESLSFLGVNRVNFLNYPCGRLDQIPILEINKMIEAEIDEFQPDTILTHASGDANNDHQIVFNSTIMATRPGAKNHIDRLLTYEVISSTEWSFNYEFKPNYFVELTNNDLENKWKALSFYVTEMRDYPFPRSYEGIRALSMIRGMNAGFKFAEAFQLIRETRS